MTIYLWGGRGNGDDTLFSTASLIVVVAVVVRRIIPVRTYSCRVFNNVSLTQRIRQDYRLYNNDIDFLLNRSFPLKVLSHCWRFSLCTHFYTIDTPPLFLHTYFFFYNSKLRTLNRRRISNNSCKFQNMIKLFSF